MTHEDPRRAAAAVLGAVEPAQIAARLDRLGRLELARFLADIAVYATEPGLSDARRGRLLRQHYER